MFCMIQRTVRNKSICMGKKGRIFGKILKLHVLKFRTQKKKLSSLLPR